MLAIEREARERQIYRPEDDLVQRQRLGQGTDLLVQALVPDWIDGVEGERPRFQRSTSGQRRSSCRDAEDSRLPMNVHGALDKSEIRLEPYWWDTVEEWMAGETQPPTAGDVVIVGPAILVFARLQLLRGGRSVTILESGHLGCGCSSRNGGQVSRSIKGDLRTLTARFGSTVAAELMSDSDEALRFISHFVASEGIDCNFQQVGRFVGANSRRAFDHQKVKAAVNPDRDICLSIPVTWRRRSVRADTMGVWLTRESAQSTRHNTTPGYSRPRRRPARYRRKMPGLGDIEGRCGLRDQDNEGVVRSSQVLVATNGYTARNIRFCAGASSRLPATWWQRRCSTPSWQRP
ncbi:FAD-dependent oxidoreductase [Mesorhizobium sp. M1348]|uniref:FAD-dependent oxidoreductase n=1 Tax=Mesorhizobium sp. M1348 TaxID=2957089 RepID=UPI003338D209